MKKFFEFKIDKFGRSMSILDIADFYIENIAEKYDVEVIKKLGGGYYGIAYLVKDKKGKRDKVIKITTDSSEALNSNSLIGKELDHFVNYYDVFNFVLKDEIPYIDRKEFKSDLFVIFQDYVRPLNENEKKVLGKVILRLVSEDYDDHEVEEKYLKSLTTLERKKFGLDDIFNNVLKQRDSFLKEAEEIGFTFEDSHIGNLAFKKNGNLTFIDLGGEDGELYYQDNLRSEVFENKFKIIENIINNTEKSEINLKELIKIVSEKLKITKTLAYRAIRDEIGVNPNLEIKVIDNKKIVYINF